MYLLTNEWQWLTILAFVTLVCLWLIYFVDTCKVCLYIIHVSSNIALHFSTISELLFWICYHLWVLDCLHSSCKPLGPIQSFMVFFIRSQIKDAHHKVSCFYADYKLKMATTKFHVLCWSQIKRWPPLQEKVYWDIIGKYLLRNHKTNLVEPKLYINDHWIIKR